MQNAGLGSGRIAGDPVRPRENFFESLLPFCGLTTLEGENYSFAPLKDGTGGRLSSLSGLRSKKGVNECLTEIKLQNGESVENALRRLKKRIDREGILEEVRNHRHFEKPSERRRRKMKIARFSAILSARDAEL